MGSRVWLGLGLAGAALAAGLAWPTAASEKGPMACERVSRASHPGGLPEGVPIVVMAAPVSGADARVVMGAYWAEDHWSDRVTYLVEEPDAPLRLRARDLDNVTVEVQGAYRAVFDCVQQAVTEVTPASA